MKKFLGDFLSNLAWPAVAGNVAWSFAALVIDQGVSASAAPRLLALLLLAIYLFAEWYRSKERENPTTCSLLLGVVLVVCIIWFAIATHADKGLPGAALLAILLVVGGGHLAGAWPPAGSGKGNVLHGCVSLVAFVVLGGGWWYFGVWCPWLAVGLMALVLLVWFSVRFGKK